MGMLWLAVNLNVMDVRRRMQVMFMRLGTLWNPIANVVNDIVQITNCHVWQTAQATNPTLITGCNCQV